LRAAAALCSAVRIKIIHEETPMKLVRYQADHGPELGVVRDDAILSLAPLAQRFPTIMAIVAEGDAALNEIKAFLDSDSPKPSRPLAGARLLAPIERPGKYLAIGLNYADHRDEAARSGMTAPKRQLWFNKQTTCIVGPYDEIEPGVTRALDYEAELGVVIGATAKSVSEDDAKRHVFGYFVANDVSARDWQGHSPTFTMGKSFDTHGPIGPWIVTADEVADPHALGLRCLVNGEVRQDSNTSYLIYNIWQQIAYLSAAFTLEPGDLIATGTPGGVGAAMEPPVFLKPGDVVRCEVDGIGAIENRVAQKPA
jgi:2-keto-4-pentenoate hydratase/2-oxohepta-3-ene-1,7-dioic acid hydratase in catechol pathway